MKKERKKRPLLLKSDNLFQLEEGDPTISILKHKELPMEWQANTLITKCVLPDHVARNFIASVNKLYAEGILYKMGSDERKVTLVCYKQDESFLVTLER